MLIQNDVNTSNLWEIIEPVVVSALSDFYEEIQRIDEMSSILNQNDVRKLTAAQIHHWQETFENGFDEQYFARVTRIGQAHARVGLLPDMFVKGYGILYHLFYRHASLKHPHDPQLVIRIGNIIAEAVFMDMSHAIQQYRIVLEQDKLQTRKHADQIVCQAIEHMRSMDSEVKLVVKATRGMDISIAQVTNNIDNTSSRARQAGDYVDHAVTSVNALQESYRAISGFLDLVTGIANETRLLSFNAAIEAARAGEAGRGFTVVADEVHKLAKGSASGAEQISTKLREMHKVVDELRELIANVQQSFTKVLEDAHQIADAMHEQKSVTTDLDQRMYKMHESVGLQIDALTRLMHQAG